MSTISKPPFSRRISVRSDSPYAGSITAGIVRDFVKAMDEACIPDEASVSVHRENSTLHTTALSVAIDDYLLDHKEESDL